MLVVVRAERVDVSLQIRGAPAALRDERTEQILLEKARHWAVGWCCQAAEYLPVLEPRKLKGFVTDLTVVQDATQVALSNGIFFSLFTVY